MWRGYEWPAFLRFWSEKLELLVRRHAENDGTRSAQLLPQVVGPVIAGTGIVMTVSFLERVILDSLRETESEINWVKLDNRNWAEELEMDLEWPGWPLMDGLTRLRHCFAHEYGRATQRQLRPLLNLSNALADQPVTIAWGPREFAIGPFFSIDQESKDIILSPPAGRTTNDAIVGVARATRITFLSFLEELEKVGVVDLQEWRDGAAQPQAE